MNTISLSGIVATFIILLVGALEARAEGGFDAEARQHLSLFLGNTRIDDPEDSDGFTAGIDYEYRVNRLLGLGAVIEHAAGDVDSTTALFVADIHIYRGFIIQTGPGYEWVEDSEEDDRAVYRLGALYEFELGDGVTLSPQVHWDFADDADDALVFGIAIGRAF